MNTIVKFAGVVLVVVLSGCNVHRDAQFRKGHWVFGGFERPKGVNPIIEPDTSSVFYDPMLRKEIRWEDNDTFNPAAVVKGDSVYVIYRAEDRTGKAIGHRTSRLGLAASADGIHFERLKTPVFYPAPDDQQDNEWPGGTEDPRIAQTEDGRFVMFYTQWNRKVPRLGVAISTDLKHWVKYGPIFKQSKNNPNLINEPHKSASIVTVLKGNKQVISKINGKYWLYWGEYGVYGATSDNLIDWEPIMDHRGAMKAFISPRHGYFDSALTECGPPAVLTDKGILLLYNGKNHAEKGDMRFAKKSYSAGQVLFDPRDPTSVLARMDVPFLRPMEPFEKSGQYIDGTVFIEGLVFFKQKWFLYYGCADSKVAVAIYDPRHPGLMDPVPGLK
ncbi:putative GH43/DUF377 family glycosyl hydrolase [Sphingobacterium zeae]|uniref:GH43/DUF377 family glycosyl hydrolase n=1 Tax=Sphingobacterium zeae TaxID=1776859 RepID=A0ABU0U7J0_9SPHI|nr:glycoside hydrolase family 130 protein [Sphingobacterium zeae]MDQ1150930.1 putative GH43/DUF377 family glycosyl hydrolase [Sphingobacterium zeae]